MELGNGMCPTLYGDGIYEFSTVIVKASRGWRIFHEHMYSACVDVEHDFELTSSYFKRLHVKHTRKSLKFERYVNKHLFSIFFMVNVWTCFRGNKTSVKYQLNPPVIENYLTVTQNDFYKRLDADQYMLGFLHK